MVIMNPFEATYLMRFTAMVSYNGLPVDADTLLLTRQLQVTLSAKTLLWLMVSINIARLLLSYIFE